MPIFVVGDSPTLTNTFSVAGVPTDPTTVSLAVTNPAGTTTTYTYALAQITRDSAGVYSKQITVDSAGDWYYVWTGTGAAADVQDGVFYVRAVLGPTPTTDVLTAQEAQEALPVGPVDSIKLGMLNTAVSQMLDKLCGPIVVRPVTDELHDGGTKSIWLRQAPVSASAITAVTSITEYSAGASQALAEEELAASTAYDFAFDPATAQVSRRSSWSPAYFGAQRVAVSYEAGRYATTATVADKFKQAAKIIVRHMWSLEQGFAGFQEEVVVLSGFAVPKRALDFLVGELSMEASGLVLG